MKLEGKTVWLIGASSGIGAALAPKLAARGARLAISARREDALQEVARLCAPREALVRQLDVTDLASVREVYAGLVREWGQVDGIIYNAGTWTSASVAEFDTELALEQVDINYLGLIRVVGTVMPDMVRRRSGMIAGVASLAGYAGFPRAAAYSSSKAGMLAFLQSIRMELKRLGVEVITISPGYVESPLTAKNDFIMPFLMKTDPAAERIVAGIEAGETEVHFPKRLSVPMKLFTALPRPVFEFVAGKLMAKGV